MAVCKELGFINKALFCCLVVFLLFSCTKQEIKISLQPYSTFDRLFMDTIALTLRNAYNASVIILPERSLPEKAFVNIKTPRYRADSMLVDLKKIKPVEVSYILGLTDKDISTTKRDGKGKILSPEIRYKDWGIFGLGYQPGPACVVSTFRLKNSDPSLFLSRLKKVCIHELGHNLGLKHCKNINCVMKDAVEKIQTVDAAGFNLCDNCKRKI